MGGLVRTRRPLVWLLLIGALTLASCSGTVVEDPGQTAPQVVKPTETATVANVEATPVSEVSAPTEAPHAETPAPTEEIAEFPAESTTTPVEPTATTEPTEAPTETPAPTPRPGLEATDPATVQLGAGQVQLVEFFAFW